MKKVTREQLSSNIGSGNSDPIDRQPVAAVDLQQVNEMRQMAAMFAPPEPVVAEEMPLVEEDLPNWETGEEEFAEETDEQFVEEEIVEEVVDFAAWQRSNLEAIRASAAKLYAEHGTIKLS